MDWDAFFDTITAWLADTGIKIVIALLVWFISFRIINAIGKSIIKRYDNPKKKKEPEPEPEKETDEPLSEKEAKKKAKKEAAQKKLEEERGKAKLDKTIVKVFVHVGQIALKVLIIIMLIGYLGFDTSSITALVASLGVCIGLAVDGALGNIAGGVLLLITRPFKSDDYISACGYEGTVEELYLCNTKIRTLDNRVVYLPNGTLCATTIVNYSEKDLRRVDLTFSIAYSDDFEKAKGIIMDLVDAHPLVLKDPAPFVRVSSHSESSIDIVSRVWTNNADYWTVYFDLLESVKKAFDEQGIEIPFKQVDVHIRSDETKNS